MGVGADADVQIILMKTSEKSQQRGNICSVCLERNTNTALDNCTHSFCIRCIKRWSKTSNSCPLCREVYLAYTYKNRSHPVQPPRVQRGARYGLSRVEVHMRRLFYVPMLVYPQPNYVIYSPTGSLYLTPNPYPPTFFLPPFADL